MRQRMKINYDYFSLSNTWENISYFVRQGTLVSHLVDRARWHYCPRYFMALSFPTHLEIEVSSACQMRCPMCKTTEMVKNNIDFFGFMDLDLYKKIIDECARSPLYSIKLSWRGEPLLNPNIVEMVSYAKRAGIKDVAFLSNGERLNPELAKDLINAGLDWISISFDGMEDVYNRVRRPAVFKETVEKVKQIRICRDKFRRKKPLIRVQSVRSAIQGRESEFLKLWEGIADRVNFIADQKRSLEYKDYKHDPSYICPSPWQRMCISWDGRVAQCYGDYMMGNILGDVNVKSIQEIWRDKPFMELRRLIKAGRRLETLPCRTCSDGGITETEEVVVNGRTIKAARYVHQGIDVKGLNSGLSVK